MTRSSLYAGTITLTVPVNAGATRRRLSTDRMARHEIHSTRNAPRPMAVRNAQYRNVSTKNSNSNVMRSTPNTDRSPGAMAGMTDSRDTPAI